MSKNVSMALLSCTIRHMLNLTRFAPLNLSSHQLRVLTWVLNKDLKQFSTGVAIAFPAEDERDEMRKAVRRSTPPESIKRWTKLNVGPLPQEASLFFRTWHIPFSGIWPTPRDVEQPRALSTYLLGRLLRSRAVFAPDCHRYRCLYCFPQIN